MLILSCPILVYPFTVTIISVIFDISEKFIATQNYGNDPSQAKCDWYIFPHLFFLSWLYTLLLVPYQLWAFARMAFSFLLAHWQPFHYLGVICACLISVALMFCGFSFGPMLPSSTEGDLWGFEEGSSTPLWVGPWSQTHVCWCTNTSNRCANLGSVFTMFVETKAKTMMRNNRIFVCLEYGALCTWTRKMLMAWSADGKNRGISMF
jgi:hypothetical protein